MSVVPFVAEKDMIFPHSGSERYKWIHNHMVICHHAWERENETWIRGNFNCYLPVFSIKGGFFTSLRFKGKKLFGF